MCLLSTRAGGAGLNLVGACHLVLLDGDWNPALDLQVRSAAPRPAHPPKGACPARPPSSIACGCAPVKLALHFGLPVQWLQGPFCCSSSGRAAGCG